MRLRKHYLTGEIWYAGVEGPNLRHICSKFHGSGAQAYAETLCGQTLMVWRKPQYYRRFKEPGILYEVVKVGVLPRNGCKECLAELT